MSLLCCMSTLVSIALTALCRILEIPPYTKPIKLDISEVIIPLFSFLSLGNFSKIKEILSVKKLCAVQLKEEICF